MSFSPVICLDQMLSVSYLQVIYYIEYVSAVRLPVSVVGVQKKFHIWHEAFSTA